METNPSLVTKYPPRPGAEGKPAVAITSLDKTEAKLAVASYDRYGSATSYLNFRGETMPWFGDLGPIIQKAWFAGVDLPVQDINVLLSLKTSEERQAISDGYHTFAELYDHRIALFIALAKEVQRGNFQKSIVWRSKRHSDGELAFGGDWFVLGIGHAAGHQITYHLPLTDWAKTEFAKTLDTAPEFDGHTQADVLERLAKFF